jgi:hypothetical protein
MSPYRCFWSKRIRQSAGETARHVHVMGPPDVSTNLTIVDPCRETELAAAESQWRPVSLARPVPRRP